MPRANFRLTHPAPKLTENHVERACLDFLAMRGWKTHRLHCGRARFRDGSWVTLEPEGTPDWIAIHPQHPGFYLETKRPGKSISPGQNFKHTELRIGYRLQVVTADSVEVLIEWLNRHEAACKGVVNP